MEACTGNYGDTAVQGGEVVENEPCIDGKRTPCSQLDPRTTCGCGCDAGSYCLVASDGETAQCVPSLGTGAACEGNTMCQSNMCISCTGGVCTTSVSAGTCSAPLGGACTTSDCPACFLDNASKDPQWCSMSCTASTSVAGGYATTCPSGFVCLGSTEAVSGFCYVACNSAGAVGVPGLSGCPSDTTCTTYGVASSDPTATGYACQ